MSTLRDHHLSFLPALAGLLLSVPTRAGDFSVPAGFNFESAPIGGPVVGFLLDGRALLSTGSFGADELSVQQPDGNVTLFATGFGSLGGVAQSPVTGEIVVGDSLFRPALSVLVDSNGDGDALDAGEHVAHAAQPMLLDNGSAPAPFELDFKPGTDELYMHGSTFTTPPLGVVTRTVGGVMTIWADGMGFPGSQLWDGPSLRVCDLSPSFVGRVLTLTDLNADGDALDAGESVEFASGLSGAGGLVKAQDGKFYVSGLLDTIVGGDFSGCIGRLLPDGNGDGISDGYIEAYFDGFVFPEGMQLIEGPAGFGPGAAADGRLLVNDFTFPGGTRVIRSAPHASAGVVGEIANDSAFEVRVSGRPGGVAFFLASLDVSGSTLAGIGDLDIGLSVPPYVSSFQLLSPPGTAGWDIVLHDVPALVGQPLGIQGVVAFGGEYGLAAPLGFVIAP